MKVREENLLVKELISNHNTLFHSIIDEKHGRIEQIWQKMT